METLQNRGSLDIDAGQYVRAVRNHWLPAGIAFIAVLALAAVAAFRQEPSYKANAQLLFRISQTPVLTGLGDGTRELDPLVNNQNPLVTEVQIISSQPILEEVVDNLELTNEAGDALSPNAIGQNLQVEILAGADVIQIAFQSKDPEAAAAVLNELADIYIETNYESSRAEATRARELIDKQLPQAEAFVREAEDALRQFKEQNNVIALDIQARSIVQLIQNLDDQILAAQAALGEATSRSNQLRGSLGFGPQEAMIASDLSQAGGIQGALQRLQEVEQQLAIDTGFYTEDSPTVQNLEAQKENLRQLLQREMNTIVPGSDVNVPERYLQIGDQRQRLISGLFDAEIQRLSLEKRLETLYSSRNSYRNRADILPRLEQRNAELNSQVEVARSNYQTLLQKQQELQIAENQASGNVTLLQPATVPNSPSFARQKVILALGGLLGALLATTIIFLLEIGSLSPREQFPSASR